MRNPSQMFNVEHDSPLSNTTQGQAQEMPAGVIESVHPLLPNGEAVPRGRLYARLLVVDQGGMEMACLWRGYIKGKGNSSSTPAFPVSPGWRCVVELTQTARGVSVRVRFHVHVNATEEAHSGAGAIFSENPGEGKGEVVVTALATPAAGANFATQTMGARTLALIREMREIFATSIVVGARLPRMDVYNTGGGDVIASLPSMATVAASSTNIFTWAMFGQNSNPTGYQNMCMGEVYVPASGSILFGTSNIDAGDQHSGGVLTTEEWAVPA